MKLFKHADKRIVSSGLAIALGATVMYTVLGSYATILAEIKGIFGYVSSVIWGLVLAYVMRPFAAFVEKLLPFKVLPGLIHVKIVFFNETLDYV